MEEGHLRVPNKILPSIGKVSLTGFVRNNVSTGKLSTSGAVAKGFRSEQELKLKKAPSKTRQK